MYLNHSASENNDPFASVSAQQLPQSTDIGLSSETPVELRSLLQALELDAHQAVGMQGTTFRRHEMEHSTSPSANSGRICVDANIIIPVVSRLRVIRQGSP